MNIFDDYTKAELVEFIEAHGGTAGMNAKKSTLLSYANDILEELEEDRREQMKIKAHNRAAVALLALVGALVIAAATLV